MKSLEHIIREIREGKSGSDKKKDSLEHAIRKIGRKEYESSSAAKDSVPVEEASIGTLGTDKFQGGEFKSVRTATPHITPPKGDESHSQAPENASRQRNIAKEKAGVNRVEEENVDEAAALAVPGIGAATAAGVAAYGAYKAGKSLPGIWSAGKKGVESLSNKIDKVINPAPEDLERAQKAIQSKSVAAPTIDKPVEVQTEPEKKKKEQEPAAPPTKVAEPAKAPEAPVAKPAAELPKAAEKPAEVATPAKAEVGAKAEAPPKTASPAVPAKPASIPAATPSAAVTPKVASPAVPATAAKAATATATAAPATASRPGISIPSMGGRISSDTAYDTLHKVPAKVGLGHAKKHKMHAEETATDARKEIEFMPRSGDRKKLEYVGRLNSADPKSKKSTLGRTGSVIKKMGGYADIAESKKNANIIKTVVQNARDGNTKVFDYGKDVLVINPDTQKVTLDTDNSTKIPKDYDNK